MLRGLLRRNFGTFVSKHYAVDPLDVHRLATSMKTEFREGPDNSIQFRECNLCPKGNKSKIDNLWKLNIRKDGSYYCFRCSKGGSWFDLKKQTRCQGFDNALEVPAGYAARSTAAKTSTFHELENCDQPFSPVLPDQRAVFSYASALFPIIEDTKSDNSTGMSLSAVRPSAQDYLIQNRKLCKEILMKYGVGMAFQQFPIDSTDGVVVWEDKICITFPWISLANDSPIIERVKFRALETKGLQRLLPKGGSWGLFGWHTVRPSHSEIIITEGEYDAMAVAQGLSGLAPEHALHDIPVVSLPNGCSSLPVALLPQLERFRKIYLWMDNDKPGVEGAEKIARKLGLQRCVVVRPDVDMQNPPKDANDALRQEISGEHSGIITQLLAAARPLPHKKLQYFSDLKEDVLRSIKGHNGVVYEGTTTPSLPKLTSICKGFRKGELVIFSGPTGAGKTTMLSQLSVDFVKQGAPTLWGSFEIKNARLASKMLQQYYAGGNLNLLDSDKLEKIMNGFEALPFTFMNFHGGSDWAEILDAMEVAVYRDDIEHIIIDNLQFMMQRNSFNSGSNSKFDRFESQDGIIESLRKFATEKKVNVILVIHPRKEDDDMPLGLSSISGTAKATQEADMVIILQKSEDRMSLDVKKNRYDGQLGRIGLGFANPRSSYYEVDLPPPQPANNFANKQSFKKSN